MNKSSLWIPKYNTDVLIEFNDDCTKINIEYIPGSCYTEAELKKEVKVIIKNMLKLVANEMK